MQRKIIMIQKFTYIFIVVYFKMDVTILIPLYICGNNQCILKGKWRYCCYILIHGIFFKIVIVYRTDKWIRVINVFMAIFFYCHTFEKNYGLPSACFE